MRKLITIIAAGAMLAIAGCASSPGDGADAGWQANGDLYVAVALETAVGSLIALEQTGTLPPEGAGFIAATLGYGSTACMILADPALTPDQKRLALVTDLADERAAFDASLRALVESDIDQNVMLAIVPLTTGVRAAVRVALTSAVDQAQFARPCATVESLAASWELQRPAPLGPDLGGPGDEPGAPLPVPELAPLRSDLGGPGQEPGAPAA